MLLAHQLELLKDLGLTFHDALTPEFIREHCRLEWWDEYVQSPFEWFHERLQWLDYDFHQEHGERLSPQTFKLDLEGYDRATIYSELAERIAAMTGTRKHLELHDEQVIVDSEQNYRIGHGWIEYSFHRETFRHEYRYSGDWLQRQTILDMAFNFSDSRDGFQFYGRQDVQGVSFYYMLESEQSRIKQHLNLMPLKETSIT